MINYINVKDKNSDFGLLRQKPKYIGTYYTYIKLIKSLKEEKVVFCLVLLGE